MVLELGSHYGGGACTQVGAEHLARGLADNTSLRKLNLSWNAFGSEGTCALGVALRTNAALNNLDLSHNNIDEAAAVVLASGLRSNTSLRSLRLDFNPIG